MTFAEFFRQVKGFNERQDMEWKRVFALWKLQVTEDVSFEQFMGRAPELSPEDKFQELWELLERDRAKGKDAKCTAS